MNTGYPYRVVGASGRTVYSARRLSDARAYAKLHLAYRLQCPHGKPNEQDPFGECGKCLSLLAKELNQ